MPSCLLVLSGPSENLALLQSAIFLTISDRMTRWRLGESITGSDKPQLFGRLIGYPNLPANLPGPSRHHVGCNIIGTTRLWVHSGAFPVIFRGMLHMLSSSTSKPLGMALRLEIFPSGSGEVRGNIFLFTSECPRIRYQMDRQLVFFRGLTRHKLGPDYRDSDTASAK